VDGFWAEFKDFQTRIKRMTNVLEHFRVSVHYAKAR
jgi:hypothetical protein